MYRSNLNKSLNSIQVTQSTFKIQLRKKSVIVKHSLQLNHIFFNILILNEVTNSNYLDAFETLFIKYNPKYSVNNEPGIFHNSLFL